MREKIASRNLALLLLCKTLSLMKLIIMEFIFQLTSTPVTAGGPLAKNRRGKKVIQNR